jgi:hypothetical protein
MFRFCKSREPAPLKYWTVRGLERFHKTTANSPQWAIILLVWAIIMGKAVPLSMPHPACTLGGGLGQIPFPYRTAGSM